MGCNISKCCIIDSLSSKNLRQAVLFVAAATIAMSFVIFLCALFTVTDLASKEQLFNTRPIVAMNFMFALVCCCISWYHIGISTLLYWQAKRTEGKIFLCSVWYISNTAIMVVYASLFFVKAVISFGNKLWATGVTTLICAGGHMTTFSFFGAIVNSFLNTLDQDRYF